MVTDANVLSVEGYTLDYVTRAGAIRALDSVDLRIARGEVVGLVGESGSGKTSLAWAIMRALAPNAVEMAGSLKLSGRDLRHLGPSAVRAIRGRRIGMVFQDPSASLNPTMTLGAQITEALVAHMGLKDKAAREAGKQLFAKVGLSDPAVIMRRYPHEASGGEKQRVVIATAFACRPELILFDEPTTALDVITARDVHVERRKNDAARLVWPGKYGGWVRAVRGNRHDVDWPHRASPAGAALRARRPSS